MRVRTASIDDNCLGAISMPRFTVLAALLLLALLVAVDTPAAAQADSKYRSAPGPCAVESACLQHDWFDVTLRFYDPNEGVSKSAGFAEVDVGHEATLIYFFSTTNVEMLVKVLDAKTVNQRFWGFAAAATDLGFRVKIRNTHTGWTNLEAQLVKIAGALDEIATVLDERLKP